MYLMLESFAQLVLELKNLKINWKVVLRFGNHWEYPLQCSTRDVLHCNGCVKQLYLMRVHPPWKLGKIISCKRTYEFQITRNRLNESYLCKVVG